MSSKILTRNVMLNSKTRNVRDLVQAPDVLHLIIINLVSITSYPNVPISLVTCIHFSDGISSLYYLTVIEII